MPKKIYSIDEIKYIVTPIAKKYDVDRVLLFGSYARGEAKDTSDLDFIIDKGRLRGLKFAGMLGDLQDNFNKNVDLLTLSSLSVDDGYTNFRNRVEKDMVVIYEQ
ncbi:MAG: nucleotidyltransferase domain-containing protein [Oscillospiraceae bacterium]|nr:nucleotidyltransferase domain-containing protein [Oscillospiraceae bacterium]